MKLITLFLPEPYIKALDELVSDLKYPNRAEAIRSAVRDLLQAERKWKKVVVVKCRRCNATIPQNATKCPRCGRRIQGDK